MAGGTGGHCRAGEGRPPVVAGWPRWRWQAGLLSAVVDRHLHLRLGAGWVWAVTAGAGVGGYWPVAGVSGGWASGLGWRVGLRVRF